MTELKINGFEIGINDHIYIERHGDFIIVKCNDTIIGQIMISKGYIPKFDIKIFLGIDYMKWAMFEVKKDV